MKQSYHLYVELTKEELQEAIGRYHFKDTDLKLITEVYRQMMKVLQVEVFCSFEEDKNRKTPAVNVIMTLGSGLDDIEDDWQRGCKMLESYMLECISMELLGKAYHVWNEQVWQEKGRYPANYRFLGEGYPIEEIKDIFLRIVPSRVTYNGAYMMSPRKSVAFTAELATKREAVCRSVCVYCRNRSCQNRKEGGKSEK